MAVTIGLGSSAGALGKGQGGVPAGFEAVFAQLGGISADGGAPEGADSSALAENPFVAQLAAALQALQSGAALDPQAASLLLDAESGQVLQDTSFANGLELPFGQELPLDPSFPSAVLATFAAINEMIRQQGLGANQANEGEVETKSVDQILALDAGQAAAVAMALSGQQIALAQPDQVVGQGESAPEAVGLIGVAAAQTGSTSLLDASLTSEPNGKVSTQVSDQGVVDPGVQAVVNRLQADLAQPDASKDSDSDSAKSIQAVVTQKNGAATQDENLLEGAVVEIAADASSEFQSDADTLKASLEAVVNNAAGARQVSNVAVMQPSEAGLGIDAARAVGPRADGVAPQPQVAGASMESRIEAARASLASGPLNVEVLRLTRQGGGRAVLEVTPPNQGPIRLDLQLDGVGRANLVVEGLSDALRARLEGTAHFLRQDMAQMGLALNLEMRERSDAQAQQAAFGQGGSPSQRDNERQLRENSLTSSTGSDSSVRAAAASGRNQEDGVHLYA